MTFIKTFLILIVPFWLFSLNCTTPSIHPHIEQTQYSRYLVVNKNPFIIRSIEDHETVDSHGNVREPYLTTIKELNANTFSVTFRWSFFEKQFGVYDTSILRKIKETADKYGLKVIILWFGTNICGHENCAPDYIRNDPKDYSPYLRSDRSVAAKIVDDGGGHIFCYSFNSINKNYLLEREKSALQELMQWITANDKESTYIMLQIENEPFVHPELWRPWPPLYLPPAKLVYGNTYHIWNEKFNVYACSLKVNVRLSDKKQRDLDFAVIDTTDRVLWQKRVSLRGSDSLSIGGDFIEQQCHFAVRLAAQSDSVMISNVKVKSIAERCHCSRCNDIFASNEYQGDQSYEQAVFFDYIATLARAVKEINPVFPICLNMLVSGDAGTLIGNPFCQWRKYDNELPELDVIAADIYYETLVPFLDSLNTADNIIFVPEAGQINNNDESGYLDAFSLIFDIIGSYNGLGIQIYDLKDSKFGLLSSDWQWSRNAFLMRNSFSAISLLSSNIIADRKNYLLWGFRNIKEKMINADGISIRITATAEQNLARGIIIKTKKHLILCGIGFRAEINTNSISKVKFERGFWQRNKYNSLGELKHNSHKLTQNNLSITMDADDFLPPEEFDVLDDQYCVIISLP